MSRPQRAFECLLREARPFLNHHFFGDRAKRAAGQFAVVRSRLAPEARLRPTRGASLGPSSATSDLIRLSIESGPRGEEIARNSSRGWRPRQLNIDSSAHAAPRSLLLRLRS